MDSRIKHLTFQSLKRKHQNGSRIRDAGAHLYHAATGVIDGGITSKKKEHRLDKAFSRLRKIRNASRDDSTHRYLDDGTDRSG